MAKFLDCQWLALEEYNQVIPDKYLIEIETTEENLGRHVISSSYTVTRFGKYLGKAGEKVVLDGIIYRYTIQLNPRNIAFAYRLYLNDEMVDFGGSIGSLKEAQSRCTTKAKEFIETELNDL